MASRPQDEEIMGLYTWTPTGGSPSSDGAEPSKAIDIIAVQGLGASPYYTWVKKVPKAGGGVEEVMWLRDLLPGFVPNARIATFSYRSDWYTLMKGAKKTSIRELGEQLLMALHQDRQKIKASRRPIVFIGHSMGGLVIEQALVHASNRSECEDIRNSTTGVVLLGTPHEGTPVAAIGKFFAKVRFNDSKLLEQLQPKEEQVYNLMHDFASGYKHLSIMCFYEKLDNSYLEGRLNVPIVDKRSAVQVGRGMMYLIADHSGLNKFSGVDDPNFKSVCDAITGMVNKASEREVPRLHDHQFMVSRRSNPLFTGRKGELDKMREALCPSTPKEKQSTEANVYVLYGMGGAGKSEVALKFAYDHRPQFWGIFWVDARSESSIATGFVDVARRCGLDESTNSAVSWLQDTSHSWLLILDNADDPNLDLSPYLPAGTKGNIIITSRVVECAQRYNNAGKDLYERLDKETAVELLFKSCNIDLVSRSEHEDHAHAIVDLLGCHALAVTQAGASISQGVCKLEEYRSRFVKERGVLLQYLPETKSEYGDVYATFEVSARYLEGCSDEVAKDALQLLNFHAFMHFSDFPEEAFEEAWKNSKDEALLSSHLQPNDDKKIYKLDQWHRSNLPAFMRQTLYNKDLDMISLRKARAKLASLSLINIDTATGMTRIHPVTHAWSRDRLIDPGSADAWLNALAMLSLSSSNLDEDQPLTQPLQPHLESMAKRPTYYDDYKDTFSLQQSFYRLAWILCCLRSDSVAYEMLQLIPIKADDAWIVTSHGQAIQLLQAEILTHLGGYERAKVLLERVIEAQAENSEAENDFRFAVQQTLARIYLITKQTAEAVKIMERIVEIKTSTSGDVENRSLLDSQYELGVAYSLNGDLGNAKTILEHVVQVETEISKSESMSRLASEYRLALVYLELGDKVEATRMLKQVAQIRSEILRPGNPERLHSEYMLAWCHYESGKYEEAIRIFKQVAQTQSKILKPDNPRRLCSEYVLACCYCELGKYEEAMRIVKQVAQTQSKILKPDDPIRLYSESMLADCYCELGKYEEAMRIVKQVAQTQSKILKPDDPIRLHFECILANCYYKSDKYEEAMRIVKQVVQTQSKILKPDNPSRLCTEYVLAHCYCELGKYEESLRLARSIEHLVRNIPGEPLADLNTELIHVCLRKIRLEQTSNGDEGWAESQKETEDGAQNEDRDGIEDEHDDKVEDGAQNEDRDEIEDEHDDKVEDGAQNEDRDEIEDEHDDKVEDGKDDGDKRELGGPART